MKLLKDLCHVFSPSGDEQLMKDFLLDYISINQHNWKVKPEIFHGDGFQDCIVLAFGKPRTSVFAHMDSIGFTARYNNELVKIGGPRTETGYQLIGQDSKGSIDGTLKVDNSNQLSLEFGRIIEPGTSLVFKPDFREDDNFIQCCYMDNRLGVYNVLKLAETLEHGIIAFSCWEEAGGGSVEYLGKFIYEKFQVKQALISDITWITSGVSFSKGVVVSMRDSGIPRRSYIKKILELANQSKISFQIEVESSGGSDGNALQRSPYPFDWCFIGAPEEHVHSPDEKVHKGDIASMLAMYEYLMAEL